MRGALGAGDGREVGSAPPQRGAGLPAPALRQACVCVSHCAHGALPQQPQDAGVRSNPGPLRGQSF